MQKDDEEFDRRLFEVSHLYYELNLTQREIAETLGIPQPTVSRLLDDARNADWLQVRVETDRPYRLERELCDYFKLQDCCIALTHEQMSKDDKCARLGRECGKYLIQLLSAPRERDNPVLKVGLSGGTTLSTMLQQMPYKTALRHPTELYPALGFFATDREILFINGVVIVSELLDRIQNSTGYWLPLPPLHDAPDLSHDELETRRRAVFDEICGTRIVSQLIDEVKDNLDIVFTGMGSIAWDDGRINSDAPAGKHFVTFAQNADPQWREALERNGVIGDLSFLPFSENGPVSIPLLESARVGIPWETLTEMAKKVEPGQKQRYVVLVCGGEEKHETLYKLLTREYLKETVNVLITDIAAASFLKNRFLSENPTSSGPLSNGPPTNGSPKVEA